MAIHKWVGLELIWIDQKFRSLTINYLQEIYLQNRLRITFWIDVFINLNE